MGVYLSHPRTEKSSSEGENGRLKYGVSSMQGWRSSMEDAHAAYPNLDNGTSFFGVYDGHGGKAVAKFCAKYLHEQVLKSEAYTAGELGNSLQKSFLRMDDMMCGQRGSRELAALGDKMQRVSSMIEGLIWSPRNNEANGQADDWSTEQEPGSDYIGPTSGCTACVAIIQGNKLLVANAGDSRCVLSRGGRAYAMSKDHKPDHELEKERILNAGGYVQFGRVNGTLNLSRAIGDMELKQNKSLPAERQIVTAYPDVTAVDLRDEDEFLILACDGIWDCLSSQQAVDFVREKLESESKLSAVCEKVFDKCLAPAAGGEGCDNMTMILVQFKSSPNQGTSSEKGPEPSTNQAGSEEDQERIVPSEPQANTESGSPCNES